MKRPPPIRTQSQLLQSYDDYLQQVLGFCDKTCRNHAPIVQGFLTETGIRRPHDLAKLSAPQIRDYLAERSSDYQPSSLCQISGCLRQFLRYAQQQGYIRESLHQAIPAIANRAINGPGVYLKPSQLNLLLQSWNSDTAEGSRDHAIGLCLARLGLRVGEVARLRLEDLDWRQGILRLSRTKNGFPLQLPLLAPVGRSIAQYLRTGRPECGHREVFLFHRPVRPMSAAAISDVIRRALRRCGIAVARPGGHLLRHTLASHLVQCQATLKEVADVLGHRSLTSTGVYAHLDMAQLRDVVQPWPQEVKL